MAGSTKISYDTAAFNKSLERALGKRSEIAEKKIALLIVAATTNNLVTSRGGARFGLSRNKGGPNARVGQYAHVATGETARSIKAAKTSKGWRVSAGGNARALEYGSGPQSVPTAVLRAWATKKFPGIEKDKLNRLVENLRRRIQRNGLRRTYFWSDGRRAVRDELRSIRRLRDLPTMAAIEAALAEVRAKINSPR